MLKAILHGKAGRIEQNQDESVSWSSLFKAREDLLTSTVFERFAYLSEGVQIDMLSHWFNVYNGESPVCFGDLEGIEYWPRFTHKYDQNTESMNQVEPDLVLRFDKSNIIVEVKPPAGGDQYFEQWHKEIESFLQSEQGQSKPLYFLAIGRVRQDDVSRWAANLINDFDCLKRIAALEWPVVTEQIVNFVSESNIDSKLSKQDRYILKDILEGLSLYGLQVSAFKWPDFKSNSLPKLSLHHHAFKFCASRLATDAPEVFAMNSLLASPFRAIDLSITESDLNNKAWNKYVKCRN